MGDTSRDNGDETDKLSDRQVQTKQPVLAVHIWENLDMPYKVVAHWHKFWIDEGERETATCEGVGQELQVPLDLKGEAQITSV